MPSYDSPSPHRTRLVLSIVSLAFIAACAFAWFRGAAPEITAEDLPAAIGGHKLVTFSLRDTAGIAGVEAQYIQNGKTILLGGQKFSNRHWFSAGDSPVIVHFSVQAGRLDHPELSDGPVQLVVTAEAANLRAARASFTRNLRLSSTPPQLAALSTRNYINQGGAAAIVYRVSPGAVESGVEMAGDFFPGYALPGAPAGTMFALYAFPYNAPADSAPQLMARDAAGNQATVDFPFHATPKRFRSRVLKIDDSYISRVVMPVIENTPSLSDQHDPEKNFLLVNRDLRHTDAQELRDAARETQLKFLWSGPFISLHNGAVEADFADHRSYSYNGKVIDQEDHLGYDLAAVRHTPVMAANAGRVVWAKYFGIYGNCVLLDHGYGLMSLYAHLNDFAVKAGDVVTQGQLIAHSDSTGLAGGDHLHFSMLLDGVQINPIEWWDPNWVRNRIANQLDEYAPSLALGASPASSGPK